MPAVSGISCFVLAGLRVEGCSGEVTLRFRGGHEVSLALNIRSKEVFFRLVHSAYLKYRQGTFNLQALEATQSSVR